MPRQASAALNAHSSVTEVQPMPPQGVEGERWFELALHAPGARVQARGANSPSQSAYSERGPAFFLGGR